MPFLTTIGSAGLLTFGLSSPATGGILPNVTKYFFAGSDSLWSNLNNWYTDSAHTSHAASLPNAAEDTILLSNVSANIDSPWIQPLSITIDTFNLTLTSTTGVNVSCPIDGTTGTVTLNGANLNYPTSTVGKYFYPSSGNSWSTLGNWYTTRTLSTTALSLPNTGAAVVLLGDASADVDSWTQPASINLVHRTLTLSSASNATVTCQITGAGGHLILHNVVYTG
jgi:hypothetical protein